MGLSQSKQTKQSKPILPSIPFKNSQNFMEFIDHMNGDNGPGDQYVGSFIDEWNKFSKSKKLTKIEINDILMGNRFIFCGNIRQNTLTVVVTKTGKLYLIHTNVKPICYILKMNKSDQEELESKWHREHAKKQCPKYVK